MVTFEKTAGPLDRTLGTEDCQETAPGYNDAAVAFKTSAASVPVFNSA